MKIISLLLLTCLCAFAATAQEINLDTIKGTWEYESPKGKTKLSYKFDLDNKFTSTTERNEKETKASGSYAFDKKGELDRLILTTANKDDGTKTHMLYHFIKFISTDSIKVQEVNEKQAKWLPENKRNTMTFVRKKDKPKKPKQN